MDTRLRVGDVIKCCWGGGLAAWGVSLCPRRLIRNLPGGEVHRRRRRRREVGKEERGLSSGKKEEDADQGQAE